MNGKWVDCKDMQGKPGTTPDLKPGIYSPALGARYRSLSFVPVAAAWVALCLALQPAPGNAQVDSSNATGSIHGTVSVTSKLTSRRMRFRIYPMVRNMPPPTAARAQDDERQNVVVYLKSNPQIDVLKRPGNNLAIKQLGETFLPHVLPVEVGSTVEFPNQDPIFHNVFSLSRTKSFDLGRYPKGSSRSVTFERPGLVPVFCHIHSDMSAIILVLDNPFFAVPDHAGHYQLDNIPAGSYKLVGWHQHTKPVEHLVKVVAGQVTTLDLSVPIEIDQQRPP